MRFVHASDWEKDLCPEAPLNPMYASNAGRHSISVPQRDDNGEWDYPPSGDRLKYMSCRNCGAAIWGHKEIVEEPELWD